MFSINGIGARFYGKREVKSDGSYVATKWFIFGFFPIIPLGSFRIWKIDLEKKSFFPKEYKFQKINWNKRQIINTYLVWYGSVIFILLLFILIGSLTN